MKVVRYHEYGNEDVLKIEEMPTPQPGEGEVLIQIKATAVNPGDITFQSGKWGVMPIPLPHIPGTEAAGIVQSDGQQYKAGQTVIVSGEGFGIMRDGLSAEYVTAPERLLVPIPPGISFEQAATIPTSYLTAHFALTHVGQVQKGEKVLITGAAGAVGQAAVQIAKALGASVFASVRSADQLEPLQALGAEQAIDISQTKLGEKIKALTDGQGVDLVIENVGGDFFGEALASLRPGGRMAAVGYAGGREARFQVFDLLLSSADIRGVNLFAAPSEVIGAAYGQILSWLAEDQFKPVINRAFPLEQIKEAQRLVVSRAGFGRVVLTL